MLRTLLLVALMCVSVSPALLRGQCKMKEKSAPCQYWQSKVDAEVASPFGVQKVDEKNPQVVMDAIACLLQMEDNKHPARFSGATNYAVSQTFPGATTDVAALYYISYLYYQKWNHADAVALEDEDGEINSPEAIRSAYESYRKWFEEVRKIGLAQAREMKLEPLKDAKVKWY